MTLPTPSSTPPRTCCRWTTARFIRLCTGSSGAAGSGRTGGPPRTTAAPSSIASHRPAASNWPPKPANGTAWRRRLPVFCARPQSRDRKGVPHGRTATTKDENGGADPSPMMNWRPFRRRAAEQDLDEEIRSHLEIEVQENIETGMSPQQAHYTALRKFGNVTAVRERSREIWGFGWFERFLQDLRYGARTMRRSPGFTTTAVLTLALSIGANTAIFSVVNAVLLRPLPYRDPDRLAMLWSVLRSPDLTLGEVETAYLNFEDGRRQTRAFEDLAILARESSILGGTEEPERIVVRRVSANFFSVLDVAPALGRTFSTEQADRRERVAVLSHRLWQRRFGASPDVIGKIIPMEDGRSQVIGVMPRGFYFPTKDTEAWEPYTIDRRWPKLWMSRSTWKFGFDAVGRLK